MMIDWSALLPVDPPAAEPQPKAAEALPLTAAPAEVASTCAAAAAGTCADTTERLSDDRRRCSECGNLNPRGLCLAAYRGALVASRSYTPIRDILRRCECFTPLPSDPDQRDAGARWPGLADAEAPSIGGAGQTAKNQKRGRNGT